MVLGVEIVGAVVGKFGSPILNGLQGTYNRIRDYNKNVEDVKADKEKLEFSKTKLNEKKINREEAGIDEWPKAAQHWLDEANELLEDPKLHRILKFKKYNVVCSNPKILVRRCNRSKEALKMRNEMEKIQKELDHYIKSVEPNPPIPASKAQSDIKEYMSLTKYSRKETMDKIVNALSSDAQVHVVGLYGIQHVGKTKMANDVMEDERVTGAFGKIVVVDMSVTPHKKDVQDKLVDKINPDLKDIYSLEYTSFLLNLYIRLIEKHKILIILDSMVKKLNLQSLGIYPSESCKVMVISRMKDVCEAMGAEEGRLILEMKRLTKEEQRYLFWNQIFGYQEEMVDQLITSGEYLKLGEKLLNNYCQGLPVLVVTFGNMLKDQTVLHWHSLIRELEGKKDQEVFKSVWDKPLKDLGSDKEKKMFFYLACLFPPDPGSYINFHELMTYAMGMDLFKWVDNLTEAIKKANSWAHELISLSLLEPVGEQNSKDGQLVNVIVPNHVHKRAMSLLAQEDEQHFLVRSIPRWHTDEMCQDYRAISLIPGSSHSRLNEMSSDKLEILILNGSHPQRFTSTAFFKGMKNLKVLVLKNMILKKDPADNPKNNSEAPNLKKLRLLSLERCELKTTKFFDGLMTNLVVLSLCGSTMEEEFSAENCCKLRLLNLRNCRFNKGIPVKVLEKFTELEGLYAYNCFENWETDDHDDDTATRISLLNNMKYLSELEMKIRDPCHLKHMTDKFAKKLNQFHICIGSLSKRRPIIGSTNSDGKSTPEMLRILEFESIDVHFTASTYTCVKELLKKSELLKLRKVEKLQQFIHLISSEELRNGFRNLQKLEIFKCYNMEYFSRTPFKASNLGDLRLVSCNDLKFFFETLEPSSDPPEFQNLKFLKLIKLQNLETMLSESNCNTISIPNNDLQGKGHLYQAFFHPKLPCPKLEELELEEVEKIVKLWDFKCREPSYMSSFNNLKSINIWNCRNLEALASFAIATALIQLKELMITDCQEMKEVIISEEEEDDKNPDQQLFPSLERITLERCSKLQFFLTGIPNQAVLELSSLQTLEIKECSGIMHNFSSTTLKAPKLCNITLDNHDIHPNQEIQDINSFLHNYVRHSQN